MDYGKGAGPLLPIVPSVAAVKVLPNTGTAHYVVEYIAIASIVLGVAIVTSNVVRFIAKARLSA